MEETCTDIQVGDVNSVWIGNWSLLVIDPFAKCVCCSYWYSEDDDSNFIFGTLVCGPEYICGLECLQSPQDLSAEKEGKMIFFFFEMPVQLYFPHFLSVVCNKIWEKTLKKKKNMMKWFLTFSAKFPPHFLSLHTAEK